MVLLAPTPVSPYITAAGLIRDLPQALRDDRTQRRLTYTAQAKLIGVGADTLMRLDTGSNPTQATILACCDYLGRR